MVLGVDITVLGEWKGTPPPGVRRRASGRREEVVVEEEVVLPYERGIESCGWDIPLPCFNVLLGVADTAPFLEAARDVRLETIPGRPGRTTFPAAARFESILIS